MRSIKNFFSNDKFFFEKFETPLAGLFIATRNSQPSSNSQLTTNN